MEAKSGNTSTIQSKVITRFNQKLVTEFFDEEMHRFMFTEALPKLREKTRDNELLRRALDEIEQSLISC